MRGVRPTGLLLLLLSPFAGGCWSEAPEPVAPAGADLAGAHAGGVPAWVPAFTPQQAALLASVQRAVKAPARRVFPDLERFAYANNQPLANTGNAVKFTRMVQQVLNDSPRFYAMEELPAGAENPVTQYGPAAGGPDSPDGYKIARRTDETLSQLVPAPSAEEARAVVARGAQQLEAGDVDGAVEGYRAALARLPAVPALRVALASALLKAGRAPEAEAAYREALAVDVTFAPAHLGLAELADRRGDRAAARRALVEGLAWNPAAVASWPRAAELLHKLAGGASGGPAPQDGGWYDPPPSAPGPGGAAGGAGGGRIAPFPLFLDVDAAGVIHAATVKGEAAQLYGGCRAVMRYEPALRAQIFQQPRETPYFLSVAEEVVCLEAALGAYLGVKTGQPDADLEQLLRIAREDGLSGYVMFEILGPHRPDRARTAPADVHRDTVAYLEHWVLSTHREAPAPPPAGGVYTAARSRWGLRPQTPGDG